MDLSVHALFGVSIAKDEIDAGIAEAHHPSEGRNHGGAEGQVGDIALDGLDQLR